MTASALDHVVRLVWQQIEPPRSERGLDEHYMVSAYVEDIAHDTITFRLSHIRGTGIDADYRSVDVSFHGLLLRMLDYRGPGAIVEAVYAELRRGLRELLNPAPPLPTIDGTDPVPRLRRLRDDLLAATPLPARARSRRAALLREAA